MKPADVPEPHVDDWHANLIRIGSKKIVLFCSTQTLFACVTPPVSRAEIRNLESIFYPALEAAMKYEGHSAESIEFCGLRHSDMVIAKTNDKSVLGTMNDYLYHIESIVWDVGDIMNCNFGATSYRLNEMPQVKRDFFSASEAFKKTLIRGVA